MNQQLKQRIEDTTYTILNENGLHNWTVSFGSAYNRLGSCSHHKKTIRFSMRFAEALPWEETYDTILHEIAHAIVGPGQGHNYVWRNAARELGLSNPQSHASVDVEFEKPWIGTCPSGHTTSMARAPQRVRSCGTCSGGRGFSIDYLFEWKKNGKKAPMPVKYQREMKNIQIDRELSEILASSELANI